VFEQEEEEGVGQNCEEGVEDGEEGRDEGEEGREGA